MALTIEDGTGVTGADSFITLDDQDAICTDYFAHVDTGSDTAQEAAIRRAFLYLKSLRWKSEYPFPTLGGTIPDDVKTAQGILAHFEKETPNALQPSVVPGQQKVLNRVGEIGWKVTGTTGVDAQKLNVTMVESLLAPYLVNGGASGTTFLLRA
jgi:hypothetical protein